MIWKEIIVKLKVKVKKSKIKLNFNRNFVGKLQTMSSLKYQELIDEYKQQIPDELYRQLCNLNMEKNKEEEEEENIYEVTVAYPSFHLDDDCDYFSSTTIKKILLKLTNVEYEFYRSNLDTNDDSGYDFISSKFELPNFQAKICERGAETICSIGRRPTILDLRKA